MSDQRATEPLDVLLVEDNPAEARLVREAFETANVEATVHAVTDGDDALSVLSDRRESASDPYPDLLLLDLNLPSTDGFDVLRELRDDPDHRLLPVLVLTSSKATEDVMKSYELSANAYLTKPSDHDEYVSMVRSVEEFWSGATHLPPVPA